MQVTVEKLTGVQLLQRANRFTTGRDSHMDLATAYRYGHSPIRTQLFWIECTDIPLFVASQLVRSHVGIQCFQLSKRTDRGGEDFRTVCTDLANGLANAYDFKCEDVITELCDKVNELPERFDRYAPTDLAFIINAEALINMAHKRLCTKASVETRTLMAMIAHEAIREDPDLAGHLVPQCIWRGGICPEPKSCGYIHSDTGIMELNAYENMYGVHIIASQD